MVSAKRVSALFLVVGLVCCLLTLARAKEAQDQPYRVIGTAALQAMLESESEPILVIDARNPEEYEDVHIPGAINIPQKKFEEHRQLLPEEKTTRLVFYCNGVK